MWAATWLERRRLTQPALGVDGGAARPVHGRVRDLAVRRVSALLLLDALGTLLALDDPGPAAADRARASGSACRSARPRRATRSRRRSPTTAPTSTRAAIRSSLADLRGRCAEALRAGLPRRRSRRSVDRGAHRGAARRRCGSARSTTLGRRSNAPAPLGSAWSWCPTGTSRWSRCSRGVGLGPAAGRGRDLGRGRASASRRRRSSSTRSRSPGRTPDDAVHVGDSVAGRRRGRPSRRDRSRADPARRRAGPPGRTDDRVAGGALRALTSLGRCQPRRLPVQRHRLRRASRLGAAAGLGLRARPGRRRAAMGRSGQLPPRSCSGWCSASSAASWCR